MNRKQFVILLVVVAVIGAIGLLVNNRNTASWQSGSREQKVLSDFPMNDVARITIKQTDAEVNLVRTDAGWTVKERNDHRANFEQISDFVRKAAELKPVQTLKVGPSQRPRMELVEPGKGAGAGTLVEFKGAGDKTLATVLLGKQHMRKSQRQSPFGDDNGWPDGRYLLVVGSSEEVVLVNDPLSSIDPNPANWLDKTFFKVEKVRAVSYKSPNPENSWKVARETESGEWKLVDIKDGEDFDKNKVSGFSYALSSPSFNDLVLDGKPEETGLDNPTIITLDTFDDFTYTLKVGSKTADDNYPVSVSVAANLPKQRTAGENETEEDKARAEKEFKERREKLEEKLKQEKEFEKWTYLVNRWSLESLLKDRPQLMADNKSDAGDDHSGHSHDNDDDDDLPDFAPNLLPGN